MFDKYILSIKMIGDLEFKKFGVFNSIDEAIAKVRWIMLNGFKIDSINIRKQYDKLSNRNY